METITKKSEHFPLVRDRLKNFHGKQVLYVSWDHHTMICAPIALLVEPDMTFGELVQQILPGTAFAKHPDYSRIDWAKVEWLSSDHPFIPRPSTALLAQGLGHKSFVRMRTPGLNGIAGTGC